MVRPVDLIQRIADSGWEDGKLYADELNNYFDHDDEERLTAQQAADQEAARVVELEKEHEELERKYQKLLEKNYELIMSGATSNENDTEGNDDKGDGEDENFTEAPINIEDLKFEKEAR